jgi:hypothetical protein
MLAIQRRKAQCHHYTRKNSHVSFKWAWNESQLELLTLITFNKNGQEYTKNFKAMKKARKAQLTR